MIAEKCGSKLEFAFVNSGDKDNDTIPKRSIFNKVCITFIDGPGDRIQSSSWLLK